MTDARSRPTPCQWCGRPVADSGVGRRKRYCRQSCRQRAYEQRAHVHGTTVPADAVILSRTEADELIDRLFTLRCAAEDVATAVAENAEHTELSSLCDSLVTAATSAERLR